MRSVSQSVSRRNAIMRSLSHSVNTSVSQTVSQRVNFGSRSLSVWDSTKSLQCVESLSLSFSLVAS